MDTWYRHITLAMLAHAFLAVTAHAARPAHAPPQPRELVPASGNTDGETAEKGDLTAVDNFSPRRGRTPRQPS
jgi:hypothetical protein